MNISRKIRNPSNGMICNTWVTYKRPQSVGWVSVDHAGNQFFGFTEYDAVINRATKGIVWPLKDDAYSEC